MNELVHHELTIGLPDDWEDRTEVLLRGPIKDKRCATVTITKVPIKIEMTLAQFVELQLISLGIRMDVKKNDIFEEGEIKIAGLDAYMRIYHTRFGDNLLTQRQVYILRGNAAYVITETSPKERFAEDRPMFDAIMKRFNFRLPAA